MADKYYSYVKDTEKNPYRANIEEIDISSMQSDVESKYMHGAITSDMIAQQFDIFDFVIDGDDLPTYKTYLNAFTIDTLDEVDNLNSDGDIMDIVLDVPRSLYITVSSTTTLKDTDDNNKFILKIKGTDTANNGTEITKNVEMSKSGVNYVGGTDTAFTTIHSLQITNLNETSQESFEECTITITSGEKVGLPTTANNVDIYEYYYNGVLQRANETTNNKTVTLNKTTKTLDFSDKANFSSNNADRIIRCFNYTSN